MQLGSSRTNLSGADAKVVIFPGHTLFASFNATRETFRRLRGGDVDSLDHSLMADLDRVIGSPEASFAAEQYGVVPASARGSRHGDRPESGAAPSVIRRSATRHGRGGPRAGRRSGGCRWSRVVRKTDPVTLVRSSGRPIKRLGESAGPSGCCCLVGRGVPSSTVVRCPPAEPVPGRALAFDAVAGAQP